ncbi:MULTISPECIES: phenylalanine--tRNA ligase subunit beta [unclassified Actinomyces]|uniref:phenylalanine--tRNA ligase subunit beta n=1 Tax=unclassified Actinomyces TaxID=2609248 RepID=UPI002017D363|nr:MULTISPECIES: phenylalanine--tRNA ligase subunit beta [unclassified Actinomyces]MCL3778601.1 phenylalanine--tRNA ligase subunit beta [Actinomyces sp. AC-20-1]MCL3790342.1 phenylalanine--tRNA ligase subunit beta [Actinomyces sp. 187325]MCL3792960.1 phenylalanine--tRNA ligase subunit beta [Actinomyces sp. 186855]MCL3795129.1 phenylalanine--tRNA ligase subunit beta [Actinomyces sp. 217892]
MPYVPIEWLREHVDVPTGTTAEQLALDLVRVGLEEERIVPPAVTGPLVVGKVLSRQAKEQSNGKVINYCRVDVGEHNDAPGTGKEPSDLPSRGIVCGAHNFDVGDTVVVSLPGAVLPGGFAIAARKTYGHVSDGMICSARELGVGEDHSGIIVLDRWLAEHGHDGEELPAPGSNALPLLGLGDEVLEINITPDRGYCFSMRGVAREYAHSTGARFRDPADAADEALFPRGVAEAREDGFPVVVAEDPRPVHGRAGCDRYVARVVRGIDPAAESPQWMRERLTAAGMRPISLAVDVTNYVMLDLGQPLHAFDLDRLSAPVVVRRARPGETLTFLDEVTRTLDAEDLVICDSPDGEGSRPLVLAGVFGGAETEVSATTTDVLIEAAHFDAVSVARSARRHRLPTESSKRNERGVDTALAPVAAQRAVDLLVEYGGGTADEAATDINRTEVPQPMVVRADAAERLTGVAYGTERVTGLLRTIGCTVVDAGQDEQGHDLLRVTAPTWRPDLVGAAHLAEEVARLDGYDRIPVIVPTTPAGTGLTLRQRARRDVVRALTGAGLTQVLSYPFVGDVHERLEIPAEDPRRRALRLANPLQEDAPLMRTSVIDSLVDTARRNVSRGLEDVALYEVGTVTLPEGTVPAPVLGTDRRPTEEEVRVLEAGIPYQPTHIGVVLAGERERAGVLGAGRAWDWADAVQVVRTVAAALGAAVEVRAPEQPYAPWHPGRTAEVRLAPVRRGKELVAGAVVAHAGELHPRAARELGLPARACAAEIDLEPLLAAVEEAGVLQVSPVLTFPPAKEDVALVVDEAVPASQVEAVVRQAAGDLVEEVRLFDVFRGEQIGEGRKSLAFSLRLRAERTLTAEETAGVRKRIVKQASKRLGAELRG